MWRRLLVLLLCGQVIWSAALPTAASSQLITAPSANPGFFTRYGFSEEDVGYILFQLSDGRTVEAHRPDDPRIPASTTKVVTAVAALQVLGADYRFNTTLWTTGIIEAGVLSGDLYLRGGGDPTLSTDDLQDFVATLQQIGVTRISGKFFYDESLLPTRREINSKQPLAASYNPGLSALSVNYNRIFLRWRRNAKNTTFSTTVISPADSGSVRLTAITTGILSGKLDRRIKFLPASEKTSVDRWLLSPLLPPRGTRALPVKHNPGRIAALLFHSLCARRGIILPSPQPGVTPTNARRLAVHFSAPLSEIIVKVLRYSNNLAAELIGQMTAYQINNHALPLHESAAAMTQWYRHTLPQTNWSGFVATNHSGLSSATRHTPRQFAEILRYAWQDTLGDTRLSDLLSPPHWDENERLRAFVKAKSGTMSYADGLVGYLTTKQGRQLGYAILLTDFEKRAALDARLDVRIPNSPPEARAWTHRAKKYEKALIARWIMQY